jgi:hypothetical protein
VSDGQPAAPSGNPPSRAELGQMRYGDYCVGFFDVLGQQSELDRLTLLPRAPEARERIEEILRRTARRVLLVRSTFEDYFAIAPGRYTRDIGSSPAAEILRQLCDQKPHQVGFSDSFAVSLSVQEESAFGYAKAAVGVHSAIMGAAAAQVIALSEEIPLRGGIEIERGIDIYPNEVYGPALQKAYLLECKQADYPRTLVGEGVMAYLTQLDLEPRSGLLDGLARMFVVWAKALICSAPDDGHATVDFLSPVILAHPLMKERAAAAHRWTHSEFERFRADGNSKLEARYGRLLNYFRSKGFQE